MKRNFETISLDDDDNEVSIIHPLKKDVPSTTTISLPLSITSITTPALSLATITSTTTTTSKAPPATLTSAPQLLSNNRIALFSPATPLSGAAAYRQISPKISGLNQIPSIRMGPPYPLGARNIVPYRPATVKFQPGPSKPMSYRNRYFNPNIQAQAYIPMVNLLDIESSDSPSSANSSDAEDDNASTSSNNGHTEPATTSTDPLIAVAQSKKTTEATVPMKLESNTCTGAKNAMRSTSTSKVIEPILIESSDNESEPGSPSYSPLQSPDQPKRKAKLGISAGLASQVDRSKEYEKSLLRALLPRTKEKEEEEVDEEILELIQSGMNMIDPTELLKKMEEVPENDKPKRLNIKGLYSHVKHANLGKVLAFLNGGTNPCGIIKNEEGKTPLHIAASKGHLEILLLLIYKAGKGKINVLDHYNRTPLYMAIDKSHMKVAAFLVKAGANILCKSTEGTNLLHVACRRGNMQAVKWLVKLGIPVNEQDNFGWTALMWSAESDTNCTIIKYLLKQGAFTNLLDNEMNVCLHWSAIAGSFECAKELVAGSPDPQINAKNKFGETPLHVAAKGDHFNVAQFLLLNGADPNIKNKHNCTPLDVCPSGSKTFHCIRIRNEVGQTKNKPYMYLSDISMGKEKVPVSCVNEVDDESFPQNFIYVVQPEESKNVMVKRGFSTVNPCKCVGTCTSECKCVRLSEKHKLWYSSDGLLDISIFEEESPVLYECTPLCSCWSYCPNRVAQKGIQHPLQVFKTRTKGWGLRALTPITQGSFVLSYIGELITDEEAERREDTYLFNLDLKTSGDEPNCMDALRIGNCGRFINHSCDANMKAVKLFTGHRDVSFPEVAFFACTDIQGKEELCFNYGDTFWDVKNENGQYCKCQSENCQYGRP